MNSQPTQTQASTIQSELERVFKNLESIENKLWSPELTSSDYDCPNDKILILREEISKIANRLETIDSKLALIGK